ncbi:HAD-IIIC family phosphatase [Actinocorallia sp. API 0066]|uniref:HAD-IIIC family phosphatase n=1 Tax=Actinocorallia sp. API 0066 TaxID=2896846 RepID=UPI001E5D83DB|nr:HAD-IIIC family phosphatase [Actinocorallia sp. API 0066]MCD0451598.1 HAD-IIIC family phosphatase [Actinocorallia sp. API 0066]
MSARERLRSLHKDGLLETHYHEVAGLLAEMAPEDAARSARLLTKVNAPAARAANPALPAVTVALTGGGLLEALRTALTGRLARHGYVPEVTLGDFGTYAFDLDDPGSPLYAARPHVTVCVLDPTTVFDEVPIPFTPEDVGGVLQEKLALWRRLAERFTAHGDGVLVFNTVPLPRVEHAQILDYPGRARLGALWREANAALLRLGEEFPKVVVLDLDPLLTGPEHLTDPRFAVYAGAHLSDALQTAYAHELAHLVRARTGRAKKVLALDLDETLWGGVLGDDGVDGIEVAHTGRGPAFHRFQGVVRQLQAQGVLLAVVSKNDQETVLAALRDHPDLRVREEHFAAVLAAWHPKPESLRTLAKALNLGADAIVFADDNASECAAVAAEIPETTVLHLSGDPALHTETLLAEGWFTAASLTDEDRARTRLYREETVRSKFLDAAGSAADFLVGLEVAVTLAPAAPAEIARLAQLTLRTNQFNLTTERLAEADVAARAADPRARVLAVTTADRFGGNGIVGAVFLRAEPDALRVENVLLSCRVFARGIEQAVLATVLAAARDAGFPEVRADYRPTAKNAKVRDLYPHYGFAVAGTPPDGSVRHAHALREVPDVPGHLTLTAAPDLVPAPLTT